MAASLKDRLRRYWGWILVAVLLVVALGAFNMIRDILRCGWETICRP